MRSFQDLSVYRQLAALAAGPNQIMSFLQLVKRVKGMTEDTARRAMERLKCEFNDPLILVQDRRAFMTNVGRELFQIAGRLSSLSEKTEPPPDVLTVEADSLLAAALLPQACAAFFEMWASLAQLKILPLQTDMVRKNIQDGATSFAVAFANDTESVSGAELLGSKKVPWVLLPSRDHRLAGLTEPVTTESFTVSDRLFIPKMGIEWPGMDGILKTVPIHNRVICDAMLGIRLARAGLGTALVPDLPFVEQESLTRRMIPDLAPVQPRFFLPRKGMEGLSEPEQSLVEQIRKVAEARCKQKSDDDNAEELPFAALLDETAPPTQEILT